jgi:hypothetical protein
MKKVKPRPLKRLFAQREELVTAMTAATKKSGNLKG